MLLLNLVSKEAYMFCKLKSPRYLSILGVLALGLLVVGISAGVQTVRAQTEQVDYSDCSVLYAVQPGDTLDEIAEISATTEDNVLSMNFIDSASDIFPGLVLCLESANGGNGGGEIVPPSDSLSGVEVTDVTIDQMVTIRGMEFPESEEMNIYILPFEVDDGQVVNIGSIRIPADGTFERSFRIPEDLRNYRNLIIRFRNADEDVSASTTFINANVDRITPQECAEYYTVQSGDILSGIAQDENVSVTQLVEINNLIDSSTVFPGQMLCTELN
jgi:LysM repeat protein